MASKCETPACVTNLGTLFPRTSAPVATPLAPSPTDCVVALSLTNRCALFICFNHHSTEYRGPPPQKLCSVLGVEEGSLFAEAIHSLVMREDTGLTAGLNRVNHPIGKRGITVVGFGNLVRKQVISCRISMLQTELR